MKSTYIIFIPGWLNESKANLFLNKLLKNISWDQPKVSVYGKTFLVPRFTSFLANKKIIYSYSGVNHIGEGFPSWFIPLLINVQEYCDTKFNGCLINLYRNGNDCMGWHADNERELDHGACIASLSLGVRRDFLLKNKISSKKSILSLGNGDLLIMNPGCQEDWIHSIPKRRRVKELRINLTFRKYK